MQLNTLRYFFNKQVIVTLTILGLVASSFIAITIAQAQSTPSGYKLVWSDEFDGSNVDSGKWQVVNQTGSTEDHHQGRYLNRNIDVNAGNLEIVTERHCVSGGELPSDSNRSSAACPSGKDTVYSSGQVRTPHNWKSGKMEMRAKLPATTQSGLWSGFWLRQQGAWCTREYGEIDILEWYSDPKSKDASTATTHITCSNNKTQDRQHLKTVSGSLADSWHVWGVEWDTSGVTYYLDGKVVGSISSHRPDDDNQNKDTASDYEGVSSAEFASIMDRPWQLRVNTQVYSKTDQWHEAPNNTASFTPQTFLVDYVRVYAKDETPTSSNLTPTTPTDKTLAPATSDPTDKKSTATKQPISPTATESTTATNVEKDESHDSTKDTSTSATPETIETVEGPNAPLESDEQITLPKTGVSHWVMVGSLPIAAITAAGLAWHHSRLRLK